MLLQLKKPSVLPGFGLTMGFTLLEITRPSSRPPWQLRTAVDAKSATCNVIGRRVCQKQNTSNDLLGLSQPAAREFGTGAFHHLVAEELALAGSIRPSGIDNVHANALRS